MTKAQYTFSRSTVLVLFFETGEAGRERREESPHLKGATMGTKKDVFDFVADPKKPSRKQREEGSLRWPE